jgi:hypothetical protein
MYLTIQMLTMDSIKNIASTNQIRFRLPSIIRKNWSTTKIKTIRTSVQITVLVVIVLSIREAPSQNNTAAATIFNKLILTDFIFVSSFLACYQTVAF